MKLKPIVLAIAALSAGAASAYTDTTDNVYLTGASAIRANVASSVLKLCTTAGGTATLYKRGSATNSLDNQMAYVCDQPMADSAITTVFHTTTGGSLTSILGMSTATAKQLKPVVIATGGGNCNATSVAGSGPLTGYTVFHSCAEDTAAASDGGFSDLEYGPVAEQVTILDATTDGFTIDDVVQGKTGVTQAFGVAVSERMYKDLQIAQGKVSSCTIGNPSTCADVNWGKSDPAYQPSLSRADIASLINNDLTAPAKLNASALGLLNNGVIEYARRVTTSGTQSSAQVYFLGKGCLTGDNGGAFAVIGDEIAVGVTATYNLGKFKVSANSGTSDVKAKLVAAGTTNYALGVMSAENTVPSPTGTTGWRFVKINDVAISDNVKNKANGISGLYDFAFEAVTYKGPNTDADEELVIDAIANEMATPVAAGGADTIGLWLNASSTYSATTYPTEVSKFQRGGNTPNSCKPVFRKK